MSSVGLYKVGDTVSLANNAVNRYLCNKLNLDIIGEKGIVTELELSENYIDKCVVIDDLAVIMRYFPIWNS